MSVKESQINGVCPNCRRKTTFRKSNTPGPYYVCDSCESEVKFRNIKSP